MALWNKSRTSAGDANAEAERLYLEGMINSKPSGHYGLSVDHQALSRRITGGGLAGYSRPMNDVQMEGHRKQMLAMRLRISEGDKLPFDDIHTSLGKEKVFVFVVQNDQAVTLEDDPLMFPSDTLITQLRLIAK